jgi:pyrroloquinoline quinone biosynthesis protein E
MAAPTSSTAEARGSRKRFTVGPDSRPALRPYVRIAHDPVRRRTVLLAPERVLSPDAIAIDVLGRCDGGITVGEIAVRLAAEYAAPADRILPDIVRLLQDLADKGIVSGDAASGPRPASRSTGAASKEGSPLPPGTPAPIGLLAELTHRCPLQCPYCSNPVELERPNGELDPATWARVFEEARALGVLQLHLSGGEPTARPDLEAILEAAVGAGLYTNLITSGVLMDRARLSRLAAIGLDHVQLSIQDSDIVNADRIGHYAGGHAKKQRLAADVIDLGLALTINAPVHRQNIGNVGGMIDLALAYGAGRIEIANVQYYGWAVRNRAALMPSREAVMASLAVVQAARRDLHGVLTIDYVAPDYYADRPKPCVGGWGRTMLVVTPTGKVLPCHAAASIPQLTFENVRDRPLADIWGDGAAFRAFRGTDWMKEPCRSCDRREIDWGGCRCQAMALAGAADATDPACRLSPDHAALVDLASTESAEPPPPFIYRRYQVRQ